MELKIQNLLSVINIMSITELDENCATYKVLNYIFDKEMKDLQLNFLFKQEVK